MVVTQYLKSYKRNNVKNEMEGSQHDLSVVD